VRDARATRRRFDGWGRALPGDASEYGDLDDGIQVVDVEIVEAEVDRVDARADEEEVAVTGQGAAVSVGYFDDGPATHQVVSRAVAASQDLAVRTQALATRAPDLIARIGDLKDDIEVVQPEVAPAPHRPEPAIVPTADAIEPADAVTALRSLATLLEDGRIDRAGFEARKAELLGRV
jgi:hypothetical protein